MFWCGTTITSPTDIFMMTSGSPGGEYNYTQTCLATPSMCFAAPSTTSTAKPSTRNPSIAPTDKACSPTSTSCCSGVFNMATTVTSIATMAFYGCLVMKSLVLASTVTSIGFFYKFKFISSMIIIIIIISLSR